MKRFKLWQGILTVAVLLIVTLAVGFGPRLLRHLPFPRYLPPMPLGQTCDVPLKISTHDENKNGILDALDLVAGARQEVTGHTLYNASWFGKAHPSNRRLMCHAPLALTPASCMIVDGIGVTRRSLTLNTEKGPSAPVSVGNA